MKVANVMNPNPATVQVSGTFGDAFAVLTERRVTSLPVVDPEGKYRGLFDLHDIWELLLPRAAMLDRKSIPNLSFVGNSDELLREKLAQASSRPLAEFLDDRESPAIPPDMPILEAVLLFHQHRASMPVVEPATRRLVGILSPWEVIGYLR